MKRNSVLVLATLLMAVSVSAQHELTICRRTVSSSLPIGKIEVFSLAGSMLFADCPGGAYSVALPNGLDRMPVILRIATTEGTISGKLLGR